MNCQQILLCAQDDLETYSRDATAPPPEEQIRAGEEGKLTSLDTAGSILVRLPVLRCADFYEPLV